MKQNTLRLAVCVGLLFVTIAHAGDSKEEAPPRLSKSPPYGSHYFPG